MPPSTSESYTVGAAAPPLTGAGLDASHQTGWTALVALLLQRRGSAREAEA